MVKFARRLAAWLAIVGLLINGLLPTTAIATSTAATPAFAMCNAAAGQPSPAKRPPALPLRHCALCAAFFTGPLPSGHFTLAAGGIARRIRLSAVPTIAPDLREAAYRAAQPRAPPPAAA